MKTSQFFENHNIIENPFSQEDASTDHVFSEHCVSGVHHPDWDKIFGKPDRPSTSVVFGEKGSGKTALRLQMINEFRIHNNANPEKRSYVIEYDDFNPFLDSFRERLHGRARKPENAIRKWRLWDHMDAILTLGVTKLVGKILDDRAEEDPGRLIAAKSIQKLSRNQKRDVLLLSSFYDHSLDQNPVSRWGALKRKLKFSNLFSWKQMGIGILATFIVMGIAFSLGLFSGYWKWIFALILAGWMPLIWKQFRLMMSAMAISRQIRVTELIPNVLRKTLSSIPSEELLGQPIPSKNRSDDRYELLAKFQGILKTLGFNQIIVVVDRVDEPHLINGSAERMRDLIWPMFDNKFLKHPGFGFKLLLPSEMAPFLQKQERDFYERSRLDKQNLIMSLTWSGESLYDMTNDRIRACSGEAASPANVQDLFDESVSKSMLIDTFSRLRVPRHLFKFFHKLIVNHCRNFTEDEPVWNIGRESLQTTLALYMRDLEAFDRGAGTL
ncbi:MAG: hypothetical protein JKY95_16790 [Planctomycetaceae bacterium]|nr:hypothetical protein [Planctomycetaceae bacterium]